MEAKYPFGDQLAKENFHALRKLAQKLPYKDFSEATGFGHGIHNRLRRFPTLEGYKKYIEENRKKYPRRQEKAVTLRDVYDKLVEIEGLLKKI